MKAQRQPTVQLINLGCAKNVVDAEEMLGLLERDGFGVSASSRRPDVVIVNTCGFLKAARDESLGVIKDAARRRKRGDVGRLIVAGCMVQRYRDDLTRIGGIDALVGPGQNACVAQTARDVLGNGSGIVRIADSPRHQWVEGSPRMLSTPPWTAYLKIGEGCDHACAFCTIPSLRGPYTSKPLDRVVAEARDLADRGVMELNLVAQDTTRYGSDLPDRPSLADLLAALSGLSGVRWIRVFYAYPSPHLAALAEAMVRLPKVCRYLDVPLQHADHGVLSRMRRPGSGQAYLETLARMREAVDGIAIRTTLIAGFPGEDEEAFERLIAFVEEARFDRLGVFEFSPEPGAVAAELPDQVAAAVRRRRRDRLMRLQQSVSLGRNREWIGREMDVLVEARRGDTAVGRSYRDGPEVDGTVVVERSDARPGSFVRVRITDADVYDLKGVDASVADGRPAAQMPMEAKH